MKFQVSIFLGQQEIPHADWKYLVIQNKNVNRNVNAVADKPEAEHPAISPYGVPDSGTPSFCFRYM